MARQTKMAGGSLSLRDAFKATRTGALKPFSPTILPKAKPGARKSTQAPKGYTLTKFGNLRKSK